MNSGFSQKGCPSGARHPWSQRNIIPISAVERLRNAQLLARGCAFPKRARTPQVAATAQVLIVEPVAVVEWAADCHQSMLVLAFHRVGGSRAAKREERTCSNRGQGCSAAHCCLRARLRQASDNSRRRRTIH